MKIAFWSPVAGQGGTTSNMLTIALMAALNHDKRFFLTQFHFKDHSLERALLGTSSGKDMFENIGLDFFMRNLKISELNQEMIHNASFSFLGGRLHMLPGTTKENENLYELEINKTLEEVLFSIDKYYDGVFIDTPSGRNKLSEMILEEADLIVVNLKQNNLLLKDYFINDMLPKEKVVYIIGSYNEASRYNLKNLERSFKPLKNKTAVIPYNVDFMDSVSDGKVMNYMVKGRIHGRNLNYEVFQKEIKKGLDMIMERFKEGDENV